jgi:predicted  nucleic acid-binding Zn-ribbon protein
MDVFAMAKPILLKKMKSSGIKSYLLIIDDNEEISTFPYSTNVKQFIDSANERIVELNKALEQYKEHTRELSFEVAAAEIRLEETKKEIERINNGK